MEQEKKNSNARREEPVKAGRLAIQVLLKLLLKALIGFLQ
jgi:hypothetical protein